ncbi:MAG: tyrosine--tRNA ligase [Spirochaetales bacterium]|nr:tyrosine--tRNA ligase [Spirochaetales bacterium]
MPGVFKILKERGFIKQTSNEEWLKDQLNNGSLSFYCGFDPTGPSLHIGHLVPLFAMSHMQKAGHKPIALVGGGTARIGDPSGKTEMRKMLTIEDIKANAELFKAQISRFVEFGEGKARMVDNADWLADLNYISFLRDIGKHFSVNRMLTFETYKMRMETGLSFIEFNYQIMQSYDFLVLNQKYGCTLQIGGDDQWGNIVSGIDLVRRIEGNEVHAMTNPLVTRSDGKKMGKTEKGALFLNTDMTSVYDFYQYWVNVADADVGKFLKLYTYLPIEEITRLEALKDAEINEAKKVLAFEITRIVHGKEEADKVKEASEALFSQGSQASMENVPSSEFEIPPEGLSVIDLFSASGLCATKSDARRLIQQGGAQINDQKYTDINQMLDKAFLSQSLILKAGKKRYWKMIAKG